MASGARKLDVWLQVSSLWIKMAEWTLNKNMWIVYKCPSNDVSRRYIKEQIHINLTNGFVLLYTSTSYVPVMTTFCIILILKKASCHLIFCLRVSSVIDRHCWHRVYCDPTKPLGIWDKAIKINTGYSMYPECQATVRMPPVVFVRVMLEYVL